MKYKQIKFKVSSAQVIRTEKEKEEEEEKRASKNAPNKNLKLDQVNKLISSQEHILTIGDAKTCFN